MLPKSFLAVLFLVLPLLPGFAQAKKNFNPDEQRYIQEINARGGLRAANVDAAMTANSLFHSDLFKSFAQWLGVKSSIGLVTSLELFGDGKQIPPGVQDNPSVSFTPKIFEKSDLVIGSLTIMPWRTKLMGFAPIIPNAAVLVVRKTSGINSLGALAGKRVLVPRNSSLDAMLGDIEKTRGISVKRVYTDLTSPYLEELNQGAADATIADALDAFTQSRQLTNLGILEPVSDVHYLCWSVKKGNSVLLGLLDTYLREATRDGTFARLVLKNLKVALPDYFALIGFRNSQQVHQLLLTAEERAYLDKLRAKGSLTIATTRSEDSYMPAPDGSIKGFDYHMARDLAATLGLSLELVVQTEVSQYFTRNGVFDKAVTTDASISYVPDLFKKVDLYAAPFAMNAWRQRLTLMIPVHPYSSVFLGRNGDKIKTYKDMDGKRFALLQGGFQESIMTDLMAKEGFKVQMVYHDPKTDSLAYIISGKADFTLDGALFLASGMKIIKEGKLTVSPVKIGGGTVAWAVAPDNVLLASIIKKYLASSQSDGTFGRIFKQEKGIDFNFYLELIGP